MVGVERLFEPLRSAPLVSSYRVEECLETGVPG